MPQPLRTAPSFRSLDLNLSPAEAACALRHLPGLVFFDSAGNHSSRDSSPVSIVGACPVESVRGILPEVASLRTVLQGYQQTGPDCGFPLGAACGTIDYDGRFDFGFYPDLLIYSHRTGQWFETGSLAKHLTPREPPPCSVPAQWESDFNKEDFIAAVRRAQEYIAAGDIYQVNLTQRFHATVPPGQDLSSLYLQLREHSPAPMAAWLRQGDREILSSSPETFLRMHHRQVETRPIKGTRPRFADPEADSRSAFELKTSEKELAELVMITDLERNDLGRVCEFGSVRVDELCRHEKLEHVHHLVSTVTGRLQSGCDQIGALCATLPGGSITGAPKKRACEIISELEPVPRGLYTGVTGYLGFNGESQFNIAIRTLVHEKSRECLSYHVGAGIVADSNPLEEYKETLIKGEGIRRALADCPPRSPLKED